MHHQRRPSAALPQLDSDSVRRLAAAWDDGGCWKDLAWRADQFWSSAPNEAALMWHHLLLAVGNFKRQGGTRLRLAPLPASPLSLDRSTRPLWWFPAHSHARVVGQ
jgi:hypothetical protein